MQAGRGDAADSPGALPATTGLLITGSSALLAREQQIYAGYAAALAALIAEETRARPDDIAPWVAANAMIGLHKALVDYVRRRVSTTGPASPAACARRPGRRSRSSSTGSVTSAPPTSRRGDRHRVGPAGLDRAPAASSRSPAPSSRTSTAPNSSSSRAPSR
jgi:hypothetical protein